MKIFGHMGLPAWGGRPDPTSGEHAAGHRGALPADVVGPAVATADGLLVVAQGLARIDDRLLGEEELAEQAIDLYRQHGAGFASRLRGRYSLGLVDTGARRVVLAVDPMGIGRVCYAVRGDKVAFGTDAGEVARAMGAPQISRQAIFDYLVHHMVPAPLTIFEGVRKLRAGCSVTIAGGRAEQQRSFVPAFVESDGEPKEVLARDLRGALRSAVADCRPDDRTGAFLSGGLDSSTVVGYLSEVTGGHAKSFSIGFSYPQYDERNYARIANQHFGAQGHEYVVMGQDIADAFPLIAGAYDEPFGNSSALPAYHCARFAKENGIEHMLAGDGGDELFAGNSRYARQRFFQRYELLPRSLRRSVIEPAIARLGGIDFAPLRKARNYVERASIPLPHRLELWNLMFRLGPAHVLDPAFLETIDPAHPAHMMDEVWAAAPCHDAVNKMLFYDWQYTLADNDLRKVETMAAIAGVRVSYPMLDPRVIDVATRVPPRVMLPGTKLRHFYKQAMTGFLPDQIINKPKHGFGLPFGLWLQDSPTLRELIFGNLRDLQDRHIVHPQLLDRLLHLHGEEDAEYYGVFVWVLAMLEQWLKAQAVDV